MEVKMGAAMGTRHFINTHIQSERERERDLHSGNKTTYNKKYFSFFLLLCSNLQMASHLPVLGLSDLTSEYALGSTE
jgi:hypothetical protein